MKLKIDHYYWLGACWGRWTGESFLLGNCFAYAAEDPEEYGEGITEEEYQQLPDGQYGKNAPGYSP